MSHPIVSSIRLYRFPSGAPEYNPPSSSPPRVETVDCGDEAASWLSDFLGQPCRLIRQSPNFSRDMKKRTSGGICIIISPVLPASPSLSTDLKTSFFGLHVHHRGRKRISTMSEYISFYTDIFTSKK